MERFDRYFGYGLHALFALLFLFAVVLFKERLYADAAYYAFHTVNKGWFHVEHGRTVLALSQIVPLIGYYLGFPLKVLLVLWSVGHELFFYGLFLLVFYGLKDRAAAIALFLVHLVGQLWMYYSPMYEIAYGTALAVLFYAILKSGKYRDDKWLVLLLLTQWFVMMSHTENFLLVFLAIAFHYAENGWQKRIHLTTLSAFVIGLFIEFATFSAYEWSNATSKFDQDATWQNLADAAYLDKLFKLFINYYPDLIILAVFALLALLVKKQGLKLFAFLASLLVVVVAVNNKASAVTFIRYFESMYHPLVFVVAVPFAYAFFYGKLNAFTKALLPLLLLLFAFRIWWIWDFGEPLRQRMSQWERIVDYAQNMGGDKYIIGNANFEKSYSLPTWANPIEALLLSASDGKEKSLSLITQNDLDFGRNAAALNDSNFMFRRFEIKDLDYLNPRFFNLSKGQYIHLNEPIESKSIADFRPNLSIESLAPSPLLLPSADTAYLMALIKHQEPQEFAIPSSLDQQFFLSYHWYQDGDIVEWDGLRTPLELNLWYGHQQDIRLATPAKPGTYILQLELLKEGDDWYGNPSQIAVNVY